MGLTIRLDDDEAVDCRLVDCQILFGGKRQPVYAGNYAVDCNFQFAESALITLGMLRRMLRVRSLRELVLSELGLLEGDGDLLH